MENNHFFDASAKAGTIGGTLISILGSICNEDFLKTVALASVGAAASFSVSLLLKFAIRKFKSFLNRN